MRNDSRPAAFHEALTERILDALHFIEATGVHDTSPLRTVELYTSHEGLLLPYEEANTAEVDGRLFRGNSNIVSGAIEDTVLMLRKVSDTASKIAIFIDAPTFFAQIKTLFHQFNDSISKLNIPLTLSLIVTF